MVAATPLGMEHETILTFEEAMAKLKISRGTLRSKFNQGLEGFRMPGGRLIYTTVEAIGRFIVPIEMEVVESPDLRASRSEVAASKAAYEKAMKS